MKLSLGMAGKTLTEIVGFYDFNAEEHFYGVPDWGLAWKIINHHEREQISEPGIKFRCIWVYPHGADRVGVPATVCGVPPQPRPRPPPYSAEDARHRPRKPRAMSPTRGPSENTPCSEHSGRGAAAAPSPQPPAAPPAAPRRHRRPRQWRPPRPTREPFR